MAMYVRGLRKRNWAKRGQIGGMFVWVIARVTESSHNVSSYLRPVIVAVVEPTVITIHCFTFKVVELRSRNVFIEGIHQVGDL